MSENKEYLSKQIITYLGNKRSLLDFIDEAFQVVLSKIKKDKITSFDVFSGGGIVSRYLKQYSNILYTNDLEDYSYVLNKCYLFNKNELDSSQLNYWYNLLNDKLSNNPLIKDGFIYRLYAPKEDKNIKLGERCFYTSRNAMYIDTARQYLDEVPEPYKTLLLAPLIYEASTKNNTSGVFKGFYKNSVTKIGQYGGNKENALNRILSNIQLSLPILSNYNCETHVFKGDSNIVCEQIPEVDLAYLDPPYNQHPYGSNYFMLNLIANYKEPKNISLVSGIPQDWNKSNYNKKSKALISLKELINKIKAKYILISYNSEGFITFNEMLLMLQSFGTVETFSKDYNVFKGCRNLKNRNIHVLEYLFLLKKKN